MRLRTALNRLLRLSLLKGSIQEGTTSLHDLVRDYLRSRHAPAELRAKQRQVVDALIRADKDFEFLMVPGAGHGVGESRYAARRRMDFFVRHLLGVEPRSK